VRGVVFRLWRGQVTFRHSVSMKTPEPHGESPRDEPQGRPREKPQEATDRSEAQALSSFVSRILEQLSVTSWLPAAMLTVNGTLLLLFRSQEKMDPVAAIGPLSDEPLTLLICWLMLLVLITTITQAFERQAIMALEGDWPTDGPVGIMRKVLVDRRIAKMEKLNRSFEDSCHRIVGEVFNKLDGTAGAAAPRSGIARFEETRLRNTLFLLIGDKGLMGVENELAEEARSIPWETLCDPHSLARRRRLLRALQEYPAPSEVLPTALGTLLTATYDTLEEQGRDKNFLLLERDRLPGVIVQAHDSARGRLNMYATMVFTFLGLAAAVPVLMWPSMTGTPSPVPVGDVMMWTGIYAGLAWLGYAAALRATRFYSRTLMTAHLLLKKS
jgi:hypothetical protein